MTVWSRPGTEEQTRYAISIASKVLEYFEEFFQIPYPLQKHDMIAIPDVGPRATDNYGSIIYRYLFFQLRILEIHERNIWYDEAFLFRLKLKKIFNPNLYSFLLRGNKTTINGFVIALLLHKMINIGCKLSL